MVSSIIVCALLVLQVFLGSTSALNVRFLSSTCDTFTAEITLTPAEYNQGEFIAIVPTGTGISADEYSSNAITDFFTSTSLDNPITYTFGTPLVPTSSDPIIQVSVAITDTNSNTITASDSSTAAEVTANVMIDCATQAEATTSTFSTSLTTSASAMTMSTSIPVTTTADSGGGGGGGTYVDQGCLASCSVGCPQGGGCPNGDNYYSCQNQRQMAHEQCVRSCPSRCTKPVSITASSVKSSSVAASSTIRSTGTSTANGDRELRNVQSWEPTFSLVAAMLLGLVFVR